ncbi:hypothetical protein GCM10027049_06160 [Mucilaginibacter puniceus]
MQIKLKSLLIVANTTAHIIVPVKKNLVHINCINRIFPAIHEHKPDGIILDHDFLGVEMEKILRRLRSNPFYKDIKISCYKTKPHTRVDDLLKTLGVQQFIYAQEQKQPAIATPAKTSNSALKGIFSGKLALRFIH